MPLNLLHNRDNPKCRHAYTPVSAFVMAGVWRNNQILTLKYGWFKS